MLDEKLIASYRQTQYRIFTEHETIDVTIDYYSHSIESLLSASSSEPKKIKRNQKNIQKIKSFEKGKKKELPEN